jgi:hypothetical protein
MEVGEDVRSSNREIEAERSTWRKAVATVEAATGIRLGPMARTRLSREERARLVELCGKIRRDRGVDIGRLNRKELPAFETLVEQAARKPGVFAKARQEKESRHIAREMAKIATDLRKPRRRIDVHEAGSITLPKYLAFDWLAREDPVLWISHYGLTVFLLAQLENAETVIHGAHFEIDDDGELALFINRKTGLGKQFDDDEQRLGWIGRLDHLVENALFTAERSHGGFLKVKLGSRLRAIKREAA